MTGWPRRGVSQSAVMRASESVTPPGGKGTITLTGFCGHCWASALVERNNNSRASFFIRLSIIAAKNAAAKHHRRRRLGGGSARAVVDALLRLDDSPGAAGAPSLPPADKSPHLADPDRRLGAAGRAEQTV